MEPSLGGRHPLVARVGGRVGLFAPATDSGRTLSHREDERFALCSTFKRVLAAAVLAGGEENRLGLEQTITFGAGDIIDYSTVRRRPGVSAPLWPIRCPHPWAVQERCRSPPRNPSSRSRRCDRLAARPPGNGSAAAGRNPIPM